MIEFECCDCVCDFCCDVIGRFGVDGIFGVDVVLELCLIVDGLVVFVFDGVVYGFEF